MTSQAAPPPAVQRPPAAPARRPAQGGSRAPLRFRALLAGAFAGLALATGGSAAWLAERSATASLRVEVGENLAEAARSVAELFDRGLHERWREIGLLAATEAMRDPDLPAEARRAALRRLHEALPDYAILLFVTPDGRVRATSSGLIEGVDVSRRDWFLAGREGLHVGDVHDALLLAGQLGRDTSDPPRFVDFAAPVRGADGELLGVVASHLFWEWAEEVERGVPTPLRARLPGAEGFILAADGTVLLGPPGWRGRSLAPLEGFREARAGRASHGAGSWAAAGDDAAKAIAGWAPTRGWRDYPGLGWTVAVRQDAALAEARAAALRDRILGLGLGVAALAALLGWALAARLARPIEILAARATTALGDGTAPAARGGGTAPAAPGRTREEAALSGALAGFGAELDAAAAAVAAASGRLDARETEFEAVLAACPIGVVRADTGGRVSAANDAFLRLVGATRAELEAGRLRWDELTPPEWLPADEAAIAQAVAGGRCEPFEKEFRRPDGTRVPVLVAFALTDRATGQSVGYAVDLTERKRAEAALAQSLARLSLAQEAAGIGIHDYDIAANRIHWDARLREIWGVPENLPVTYEVFAAGVHPEDLPGVEEAVARALDPRGTGHYEAEYRVTNLRDGAVRRVLATGRVTFREGRAVRLTGTVRDVTARRATEAALRESEARLRLFVERAPAAIAMFDTGMRYLAASRRYLRDYGLEAMSGPEALIGRSHHDLFPDLPERWREVHARVLAGETLAAEDDPFPRAVGRTDWVRWEMTPWHRSDGSVGGAVLFSEVVTARVEAERALAESEARLRRLIEVMPAGIYASDAEGRITTYNEQAASLWGRRPRLGEDGERFCGALRLFDAAGAEIPLADCTTAVALRTGEEFLNEEVVLERPDSTRRSLLVNIAPIRDGAGVVTGAINVFIDVTERRAAEEQARQGAALLRAVMEGTSDLVWAKDLEGRITLGNSATFDALGGGDAAKVLGRGAEELIPNPAQARRVMENDARVMAGDAPQTVEEAFGEHVFQSVKAPLRDGAGRVVGLVGVSRDVTEQRRTLLSLAEAEALARARYEELEQIYRHAPVGLCAQDRDLRYTRINDRMAEINGLPAEAHLGRGMTEVLPDMADRLAELVRPVLERGEPLLGVEIEGETPARPGVRRTWLGSYFPIRDANGAVTGLISAVQEVTERVRTERALAESEGRFRTLADAMPQMVWSTRPDGFHDYYNARWYEFTGVPEGSTDGEAWNGMFHPDDQQRAWARWRHSLATGEPYEIEYRLRRHDGAWRWVLGRALPVRDAGGTITRWFGTCTDIHDAKAAAEVLARGREELERLVAERTRGLTEAAAELRAEMQRREEAQATLLQAQKLEALGQLTSGVAHDFNNVLAAITGSYRLIARRTSDEAVRELVTHGERAAARAAGLVRQLLAFVRREELRPEVVELGGLLAGAREMLRHSVGARLTLEVAPEPDLWPVLADPHQLEVALLNLAVNARDAMPTGGRLLITARNLPPTERPERLRPGDYVSITVRDEGEGMSPEVLARAAEPFFTTKPRGKGTGLGLAMVRGFAEGSSGCLRIESRQGEGTAVEIVLPRAALTELGVGEAVAPDDPMAVRHGDARILLAEDNDQVRPVTAAFLRDLGYEVTVAPSAEAAAALAHDMPLLDLLVTDIEMPGADGAELAARLRAERPGLPVLFITGRPPGPALAGEVVLRKPSTGPDLARAVLERLGRRAPRHPPSPAERLLARLRTPALREAYLAWHAARLPGEDLPRLAAFDPDALGLAPMAVLVAVGGTPETPVFRFLEVGAELEARFGGALAGQVFGVDETEGEVLGTPASAYRRCARTTAPVYQSARLDLGNSAPVGLERLLLPLSEDGGEVTHVAALVLFGAPAPRQATGEDAGG